MIKIKDKEMRKLIESWEGHIRNDTPCEECKDPRVKCPINKFFKDAKKLIPKPSKENVK